MGIISSKQKQNLLLNGDMQISQRSGASAIASIGSSVYMTDRFQYIKSGSMVHNAQQVVDAPTEAAAGYKFVNSLNLSLTTPDTSIAAGDLCLIQQKIEGYNFLQIANQKIFTLSFWIRATAVGTYCVAFQNSGADRSYVAEYTVNSTNTWEYKTVTVNTPTPLAGTWNYTNGTGLNVVWTVAAGSTYQTAPNAWQTGNFIATSNQVNGTNTGSSDFRITGVMLNEGGPQPFRLFSTEIGGELRACYRYYEKFLGVGAWTSDMSTSTTVGSIFVKHTVDKRNDVTSEVGSTVATNARHYGPGGLRGINSVTPSGGSPQHSAFTFTVASAVTQYTGGTFEIISSGAGDYLAANAEL